VVRSRENFMIAVIKHPGREPQVYHSKLGLEDLQAIVGGNIEVIPLVPGVDLVANEEAMYAGPEGDPLPQNAAGILGPLMILGSSENGDFRSLTMEEVLQALSYLERFKDELHPMYSHPDQPAIQIHFGTREEYEEMMKEQERIRKQRWEGE
jgi:hypothetical protein